MTPSFSFSETNLQFPCFVKNVPFAFSYFVKYIPFSFPCFVKSIPFAFACFGEPIATGPVDRVPSFCTAPLLFSRPEMTSA